MSCIADVKKGILDDVFTKYVNGRPSYKRIGLDTIEINQVFKNKGANPTYAARQMLISKIKQIAQEYNGHISATINQVDAYSPISATLRINPNYIQHVFNTQVQSQDRLEQGTLFSSSTINDDDLFAQDLVNDNAGVNSNESGEDEYDNPTVGYFTKFIENKENILKGYFERLKQTTRQLDEELGKENPSKTRIAELNTKKRKLKDNIYGFRELGRAGLNQEILEWKNRANELSLGYYVEKDMQRLDALSNSNDLQELNEAKSIISFYELGGTFVFTSDANNPKGLWRNPFFSPEDVYITGDNGKLTNHFKISDEDIAVFQKWANKATNFRILIDQKIEEAAEKIVNEDSGKVKTYGDKQFTIDELTDGSKLKDTHWIDMWTMDITKNIVNEDSILPQVAFSQLQNATFDIATVALKFAHEVDKQSSTVIDKLKVLGQTLRKAGIEGMNQGSFSVFLEKTKDGLLTGGYAYKYSKEFTDDKTKVEDDFKEAIDQAYIISDYDIRNQAIKDAFKKKKDWYRKNTGIIQFDKIPEIINDAEFGNWKTFFDDKGAEQYKKQLIGVIGEKEYSRQVKEQKKLLRQYEADKQDLIDSLMEEQGIDDFKDISEVNKKALDRWKTRNSPFYGINNHYEINFHNGEEHGNFSNYNIFVPRRNETKTVLDPNDDKRYLFVETANKTAKNYYNNDYEKYIENDDDLYKFHQLLEESMNFVKKHASPEVAEKMAVNYLSSLGRTSAEIITNNYEQHSILNRVIPAFKNFWESIRLGFGVKKQNELSFSTKDDITGETNYKVNDNFLRDNFRAISDRRTIEEARFLQALNTDPKTKKFTRFKGIKLSDLNQPSLTLLANYLGLKTVDINVIQNRVGDGDIQASNIIKEYATHETVKENTFDLPKLIKHFTYQAAYYSAKTEALPRLTVLKNFYDNIEDVKKTNLGTPVFNVPKGRHEIQGIRKNSIARFDEHWNRVVLGNTGKTHKGVFSIGKKEGLIGQTIYSVEDRKKLNEINDLLGDNKDTQEEADAKVKNLKESLLDETNPNKEGTKQELVDAERTAKLIKIREGLGKVRTTTALYDSLMNWIRYQKLGWNINSGVTNAVEGWMSNMIIAADGKYFTPNNVYKAYGLMYHSVLKNVSFGKAETGVGKKIRILMDRFDVLVDVANELQKSSAKTFGSKTDWLQAMALTRRVEYVNQGVMMLGTLLDQKVTSSTTGKEVNVFDAMGSDGKLKPEFRTEENINTWENNKGDKYLEYKKNLGNAIELGHGNYDVLKGMMAKSTTAGKALMMFKTWLPMQLYWRFATQQVDLQSGSMAFKGKYWSYGVGSGALHGAAVGTAFAGPIGTLVGAIGGSLFGAYANSKEGRGQDITGVLQETLTSAIMLVKKMLGMPINSLSGRNIIETNKGVKIGNKIFDFDSRIGKNGFTKEDANALNSNMSDIAIQLSLIALMLLVKSMFWDDDDDADSTNRHIHNLTINKLMQLSNQAGSYVNIASKESVIQSTIGSIGVLSYMQEVGKVTLDAGKLLQGKDTIKTGVDAGHSRLLDQIGKTFVPGALKAPLSLGVENQMQRQFQPSPFDDAFKSHIKEKRADLRSELESKGVKEASIRKQLNITLPTKKLLKNSDVNREDWSNMGETKKEDILEGLKKASKERRAKKEQDRLKRQAEAQ